MNLTEGQNGDQPSSGNFGFCISNKPTEGFMEVITDVPSPSKGARRGKGNAMRTVCAIGCECSNSFGALDDEPIKPEAMIDP